MNAFCKLSSALVLAGALATPAFAASGDVGGGPNPSMAAAPNGAGMHIAQKMRDDLSKAGFTDIRIMPSSFLVRAKDFRWESGDDGRQPGFGYGDHRAEPRDER